MTRTVIIVGRTEAALRAVADEDNLAIIYGTVRQYEALGTFSPPNMTNVGHVGDAIPGWICLATQDL